MARKSLKCPPTVEPNQFGCKWTFSGMFDHHHHHHHRPHRKLLSDESHGSKSVSLSSVIGSQVPTLTFDEQLRNINITESKKKTTTPKGETSSSDHTSKNTKIWKNTTDKSLWKKIKSRYETPNKKKENRGPVDRIVVLKPNHRVVECPVDVGCQCSYLHLNQISRNKQQIVNKHTQVSFNDVRKKLKQANKLKKATSYEEDCEIEKLSLVPFSKPQEPDVFVEARRHLAERLRQVAIGERVLSGKQVSRTLERILLSSPIHESMTNKWGPLKKIEDTSASGFVEITDTYELLRDETKSSNMDLVPNDVDGTMGDACIEGSRLVNSGHEFSLDISSPKADCKSENMDNDQFRENPSPVSVLESFFPDNISSPTSTIESDYNQIQPNRLDFEEHSSQTSSSPPHAKSFMEDQEFISSYVTEMYQTFQSNWEDFLATDDYDYPLESSCDHKLLHDCVREVLIDFHSPLISVFKSKIQPFSLEKDLINDITERVDWHNGQPMVPRTLDVLVRRDIAKCGQWVDGISDRNDVVFETVDETLEELIMEAISDF